MTHCPDTAPPALATHDLQLQDAVEALEAATSVTILCHVQPDADTVGSGLALGIALERKGVPVQVAFASPSELPVSMDGLPGRDLLAPVDDVVDEVDLLVTVDCGSVGRLGSLASRLDGARRSLVIDHHRSNTRYGMLNLIDDSAESTTAVLTKLFDLWGVTIDADLAHCLYAGLVTDTGSFRWGQAGTHTLAERLLGTGIDGGAITRRLLDTHPFGWLPMLGSVLSSAVLVPDAVDGHGLVHAVIRCSDSAGLGSEEIESVIDIVRTTAEAEVAAVFKESAPNSWSVSLRSKDSVDVSEVAERLGGGGHRFAAGYTAHGSSDAVVAALREVLG
ncbi:bifunctional oligoribonuclease/PAP phosphatase NrnA [Prescottella agglutinans]|uniref:Bifunctional oligoribonuclease/PAP phosphatase NrnA n=1 Tax=Prescottella agglutinans TaxID=1644129 RepID=A0A3S3BUS6_9NOCA|nr:bifunctional oligoribonuclease/PAP phosphatase NrnA [Prescottella agglutinans]RVW09764.1 bifunctional oligoribonuclease/PAP phosphatase NrnA [Prescottella agglutinans]